MGRITVRKLGLINQSTIRAAGARYTPSLDREAPNLPIQSLVETIEALALSENYRSSLSELLENINKEWDRSSPLQALFSRRKKTPDRLIELLDHLRQQRPGSSAKTLHRLRYTVNYILHRLQEYRQTLLRQPQEPSDDGDRRQKLDATLHQVQELMSAVSNVSSFLRSPRSEAVVKNRMFLRGEWGTGKTHFFCDITEQRQRWRLPTLLLLAHRLPGDPNPLDAVCRETGLAPDAEALLRELDRLGQKANGRALLMIDGINEADRTVWRKSIAAIAKHVRKFEHVGLVLSCRSPFERQLLDDRSRSLYVHTIHAGFEDIEFDAQRTFFEYHDIPNPNVPLLVPEFSRPLFLKILCKSFAGKTVTAKSRAIKTVASGQKGMTKIFEDFVKEIGLGIEVKLGLARKTCWNMLKGDVPPQGSSKIGFAVTMATGVRDYVTLAECMDILAAWTGWTEQTALEDLRRRLVTDGLIAEDVTWTDGAMHEIVRCPYQRFSDHLICRHLLETHLHASTEEEVRRCFYKNRPLGKIFDLDEWGHTYRQPGIASAIMLEFPERMKRVLPNEERELVFYLPKKRRLLAPLVDVFLEGLLWRPQNSFSGQTDYIISMLLRSDETEVKDQALEVLVSLASRQGHPYSAERLVRYLGAMELPDRDLFWSEFLRNAAPASTIYRLFDWIESLGRHSMDDSVAANLNRLCAMYLTTTDRALRDRATKALVLLGERNPKALFDVAIEMKSFNDPYVWERMLAAAYGVLMRGWASAKPALTDAAAAFARNVYDAMFAVRAPQATTHILTRDYALGIVALARKLKPNCLGPRNGSRLQSPFPRTRARIPSDGKIRERDCVEADSAIMMDFMNYTIGSLVASRDNYDFEHEEYKGVLRQVRWRILDLGYSEQRFENIDDRIGKMNFRLGRSENGHKVDRYGKKYSWIAFFEVSGMRSDKGKLPRYDGYERVSSCDIDPSFPEQPSIWRPPLKPLFRRQVADLARWMGRGRSPDYDHLLVLPEIEEEDGPWVLLDGYIQEKSKKDKREIFTFLRGLLVKEDDIETLRSRFDGVDHPGNQHIPESMMKHYVFAGEMPWARTLGSDLRHEDGQAPPVEREAFEGHQTKIVRKARDELTEEDIRAQRLWQIIGHLQTRVTELDNGNGPDERKSKESSEVVEFHRDERVPGVRVELPVISYAWEDYHSTQNRAGSIEYPALALCDALGLKNTGNMVDLVDASGRPASQYRKFGEDDWYTVSHLTYLRRDLLESYLRQTGQRIVWVVWGERTAHYSRLEALRGALTHVYDSNLHIHRKMVVGRI